MRAVYLGKNILVNQEIQRHENLCMSVADKQQEKCCYVHCRMLKANICGKKKS